MTCSRPGDDEETFSNIYFCFQGQLRAQTSALWEICAFHTCHQLKWCFEAVIGI